MKTVTSPESTGGTGEPRPADGTATGGWTMPYAGLRPYDESERHLFFGRERQARQLRNKIFSAPLTLLYAPSGTGKTSLLKTLVVPDLRQQGVVVFYYDRWIELDPTTSLKRAFVEALGLPAEDASRPLVDLVRTVGEREETTVVLVLDQVEEFLVQRGHRFDPGRSELADLLRSGEDVQVLLALREEFLASLDAFREHLLTVGQTTHRLEHLGARGAREAIVRPAELFGVEWQEELVDRLLEDLRADPEANAVAMTPGAFTAGVELPFLQIVCAWLWRETRQSGSHQITMETYDRLGGKKGILEAYVAEVTETLSRRRRGEVALVLRSLAPPSGMKISYSVDDLEEQTGLGAHTLKEILYHLDQHRVVRVSESSTGTRYELFHDAFIRVIRPWVERQLEAQRRNRAIWRVVAGFLIVGLVIGGPTLLLLLWFSTQQVEEHERTWGQMEALASARDKERTIDNVAAYLYLRDDIDRLVKILRQHADDIPQNYGMDRWGGAAEGLSSEGDEPTGTESDSADRPKAPIEVMVSSSRNLDEGRFQEVWEYLAVDLANKRRIAVPIPLRVSRVSSLGNEDAKLKLSPGDDGQETKPLQATATDPRPEEAASVVFSLPHRAGHIVIRASDVDPRLEEFFESERETDGWLQIPFQSIGEDWWSVPRWTHPIWRAAGQDVLPEEAVVALRLMDTLMADPELLLPSPAIETILMRNRASWPTTVGEAVASRGDMSETEAIIREVYRQNDGNLRQLLFVLDLVASYPDKTAAEAVERSLDELRGQQMWWPERLPGESFSGSGELPTELSSDATTYRWLLEHWPAGHSELQSPFRIYLGGGLVSKLAKDNQLLPETHARIERLRGEVYRQCGVMAPGLRFIGAASWLEPWEFRIETRFEDSTEATGTSDEELVLLYRHMQERLVEFCAWWIDAEKVSSYLTALPRSTRDWLLENFRITDLKILLRAAVAPTRSEESELTMVEPRRLLETLVFWHAFEDAGATGRLVESLRKLRRSESPTTTTTSDLAPLVEEGVEALLTGRVEEAQRSFGRAIERDRELSEQLFIEASADYRRLLRLAESRRQCTPPEPGNLEALSSWDGDLEKRHILEILLDEPELGTEDRRRFEICLFENHLANTYRDDASETLDLLADDLAVLDTWTAQEAFWLGYRLTEELRSYEKPDSEVLDRLERLFRHSFAGFDETQATSGFFSLFSLEFGGTLPPRWYHDLLVELASLRPESYWIQSLTTAMLLSSSHEDSRDALELVERSRDLLAESDMFDPPAKAAQLAWQSYYEVQARSTLAQKGEEKEWETVESICRDLLDTLPPVAEATELNWPSLDSCFYQLAESHLRRQETELALAMVDKGLERYPKSSVLRSESFLIPFARGQMDEALAQVREDVEWELPEQRFFLESLAMLLTHTPGFEETTRRFLNETTHEYRDYLRLMLYWNLALEGETRGARRLLEERWNQIDPEGWAERLSEGDATAWRQMLIGYYLGEVESDVIFGEPETLGALERHGLDRRGLLCEAHFYDALLQSVSGPETTRAQRYREALEKVVATNLDNFHEYDMARYLLSRIEAESIESVDQP